MYRNGKWNDFGAEIASALASYYLLSVHLLSRRVLYLSFVCFECSIVLIYNKVLHRAKK